MSRIYYTKPSITELEVRYATDAAANGWGDRCYEYISRFEGAFRQHLGVKHAIATSSCTGALHMGMSAIGIGPGDEVIMADTNWIATVSPIVHLGAKPVFVDILRDSWCLDPEKVKQAITPRTRAIVAVHLYGNLCDMDALLDIGRHYNIPVIEDAAEAIGSIYCGKRVGSLGVFGTFSFHGSKTITTGEGGMFVTDDDDLYEKTLILSNHGRSRHQTKQFWPEMVGFKYKMSNIQAAVGCAQMERIDDLIAGKRRIFNFYKQELEKFPLKMNPEPQKMINGYWMPTIVVNEDILFDRQLLFDEFKKNEIDGRVFFWPLSSLPAFVTQPQNTNAYDIPKRALNLPSYHDILPEEQERVVLILKNSLDIACKGDKR
jgi:perosamine synthetase